MGEARQQAGEAFPGAAGGVAGRHRPGVASSLALACCGWLLLAQNAAGQAPQDGAGGAPAAEPAKPAGPQQEESVAEEDAGPAAAAVSVDVPTVLRRARQLRALLAGELALDVDARALLQLDAAGLPSEVAEGLSRVMAGEAPEALLRQFLLPEASGNRRRRASALPPPARDVDLPPQRQLLVAYLRVLSLPADARAALVAAHAERRAAAEAVERSEKEVAARTQYLRKLRDDLRALLSDSLPLEADVDPLLRFDLGQVAPAPLADDLPGVDGLREVRAEVLELRKQVMAMSPAARQHLRRAHAERRDVAQQGQVLEAKQAEQAVASATRVAREAAEARERALEVAERARTEAQRLVAGERARLLGLRERQANFESELQETHRRLAESGEDALAWHGKVQELSGRSVLDAPRAPDADRMFPELFSTLQERLRRWRQALEALADRHSSVPEADIAGELPAHLDAASLQQLRAEAAAADRALRTEEHALAWRRVETLREDVQTLNGARLRLLGWMSPRAVSKAEGYGHEGVAQAEVELSQISVELRYQALRMPQLAAIMRAQLEDAPMPILFAFLQALIVLALYRVWRRVGPRVLGGMRRRALSVTPPTPLSQRLASLCWYLLRVRGPIELLVVLWLLTGIAASIAVVPGVDYLWLVAAWGLVGSGVVLIVDALAARQQLRIGNDPTSHLRIRSLRFVGILVVGAGLILSLFERSVGRGTIYHWVVQACWTGSLPALLILLHWWRPVVLERIAARPEQSGLVGWIRGHRTGLKSYAAAAIGGVLLLGSGLARLLLGYVSEWEGTRRALAYLFRSEVARQAKVRPLRKGRPLDSERAPSMHPEALRSSVVEDVGAKQFDQLVAGVEESRCTLAVVAGERGAGKSVLLRRLAERFEGQALLVRCPPGGYQQLRAELASQLDLNGDASDDDLVAALQARSPRVVLIDDVHRLVLPAIGGLVDLDHLVSIARRVSEETSWVLAIGQPAWAYVDRARHERIAFDQVVTLPQWSEHDLGRLLRLVNQHAGLSPSFDDLVVPRQIDEPEEEGDRAELGYYRILWDYCGGNPGVALYWWRRSLFELDDGEVVVQLFDAPDAWDMETVPLNVRFVLRAILQLDLALPRDIAECLELPAASIDEALYFASARGYTEKVGSRYTINWQWYRTVVTALRRQKLITG